VQWPGTMVPRRERSSRHIHVPLLLSRFFGQTKF
jgi:hypothetical protein